MARALLCPGYDKLPIGTSGQPVVPKVFDKKTLPLRTLKAWQAVPRNAFVAAWTWTGYFNKEHFDALAPGLGLTHEEAVRTLDGAGLLQSIGVRDDRAGQPMLPDKSGA